MATLTINKRVLVTALDKQVRAKLLEAAYAFERILQEEFRKAKSGRVYGEEREVSFKTTGGSEKEVTFFVTRDGGRKRFGSKASFIANKGQQARERTVTFVANKGKKWREGKRNRGMHRASAPGEAPAIQTGALRKSITHEIKKLGPMRYTVSVGVSKQSGRGAPTRSGRSIAEMLEFGTENMKPRPGFRIALEKFKRGYRAMANKRTKKG